MAELVRQDDLDLLVRVLREHRVRHEDAARRADARQRRVRLLRLLAQAPLVRAQHAGARAFGETDEPRPQRLAVERLDRRKERQQQHGRDVRQADDDDREDDAGRQPPAIRRVPDDGVQNRRACARKDQLEAKRLRLIEQPPAETLVRQAVAALEQEVAVEGERQGAGFDEGHQQGDVDNDRERARCRRRARSAPCVRPRCEVRGWSP